METTEQQRVATKQCFCIAYNARRLVAPSPSKYGTDIERLKHKYYVVQWNFMVHVQVPTCGI